MRNLFRAEWIKIAGNRWVAGCLIWIFPLGALAFLAVAGLVLALSSSARASLRQDEAILWTEQAISMWNFPNNPVGRLILLGFTAVVFAGEYQWQTWKNVVPRNRRAALILVKFLALGAFVVLAFSLMSALWTAGWAVLTRIADVSYGPRVTWAVLRDFGEDYALAAGLAFTSTVIAAGYAALAAMVTRSILGGCHHRLRPDFRRESLHRRPDVDRLVPGYSQNRASVSAHAGLQPDQRGKLDQ